MGNPCVRVARGLLLHGPEIREGKLTRRDFMKKIGVDNGTFRAAGGDIGAVGRPGLRFFDSGERNRLSFGPGAGLVLGVSLGSESLRAALVDANGELHHRYEAKPMRDQATASPERLLDRIREAADSVLTPAYGDERMTVGGALPFLGVSVAWPSPVTREKLPVGHALRHSGWRSGKPLTQYVARHLHVEESSSHALNDTAAAAVAVAYDQTTEAAHASQTHPRLTVVLRLAGGIGGAMVVVEQPQPDEEFGRTSGFPASVLIGGVDHLAGEVGHVPVDIGLVARLNEKLPAGLRPLEPGDCSCCAAGSPSRDHVEAYASARALARRIDPDRPWGEVMERVLDAPEENTHKRALEDVGELVAAGATGPLAMLNPGRVVLTGALAVPTVRHVVKKRLSEVHCYGTQPSFDFLEDEKANKFIRAKGAALVVLRRRVFRELPVLLHGDKRSVARKVKNLTVRLTRNPWDDG